MNDLPVFPYIDREVIRLTAEGVWLADGQEITHERTREAFSKHLFPSQDGLGWEIRIGRERKKIEVEDTVFFVRLIRGNPTEGYTLDLTDGTEQALDAQSLKYKPGRLSCEVTLKKGGEARRTEARFLRSPFYELLMQATERNGRYRLRIQEIDVDLGVVPQD
jgi:hypothetical protein